MDDGNVPIFFLMYVYLNDLNKHYQTLDRFIFDEHLSFMNPNPYNSDTIRYVKYILVDI